MTGRPGGDFRGDRALLGVAVVLTALNLRPAITSVGPLLPELRGSLGASATWAGVLTTLPALCFAGAGLAAPWFARRIGLGPAITAALATLTVGLVLRVLGGALTVIGGTLVATVGIALVNVLIPVVVKGSFPLRIGLMTGVYTAALQGGGALGSAATPLLDDALGGWRAALGWWAALAAVALLVWRVAARGIGWSGIGETPREPGGSARLDGGEAKLGPAHEPGGSARLDGGEAKLGPAHEHGVSLLRSPLAWTVTLFFGTQSFIAYIVMGWLPEVYIDNGMSVRDAGLLLGLISLIAVPISLVVSPVAARQLGQSGWIVGLSLLGIAGVVGLVIAPAAAPLLWSVLVGLGMSVFSLALTVIALRSHDPANTVRLSGMAQGLGYLIAGTGPFLFGLLHDRTGGWTVPWLMVLGVGVVQVVAGALAGRNRHV